MTENEISKVIVDAAIEVHRTLGGPGLLESVYEEALAHELTRRGLPVQRQISAPVTYKGVRLSLQLRIDMLVAHKVIIECKATQKYDKVYESQALTYLRVRDLRLALVINFGESAVRRGIHRVVNRLEDM
jgi:GxxExxY protein